MENMCGQPITQQYHYQLYTSYDKIGWFMGHVMLFSSVFKYRFYEWILLDKDERRWLKRISIGYKSGKSCR